MPRLNFADYNFDRLVDQLKAIVSQEDGWKDTAYAGGTGSFLIELFAYVGEMLLYYLERRAQEGYIDTAQLKSSVIRLVKLINYRPKRAVSSVGYLTFSLTGSWYSKNIMISRGTIVKSASGVKFIVERDTVLRRGLMSVEVPGIQGELEYIETTSDGEEFQTITIDDIKAEDTNLKITVGGELWTLVDNFVDSDSESKHYIQETQLDGKTKITFGNGKFGMIPTKDSTIVLEYLVSDGLSGNVYSVGMITVIDSNIFDVDGDDVTHLLSVSNTSNFLGGDDAEDKEEIRREAPLVFKTGDRAVTREDYITILENIAGVATAYVWGERDEAYPDITMFNKIKVVCLLQEWEVPDAAFKAYISGLINAKEQLTVWLEFEDPVIIETEVLVNLKVLDSYQSSQIIADVGTELDTIFALGTGAKLGVAVRHSEVVSAIESVTGVDYCHVSFIHKMELGEGDDFLTVFSGTLRMDPVKATTAKIYLDDILQATDNGLGSFVAPGVLSGTIDYSTGLVSVTFVVAPTLGTKVRVEYEQDENGDAVTDYDEIVQMTDKEITLL